MDGCIYNTNDDNNGNEIICIMYSVMNPGEIQVKSVSNKRLRIADDDAKLLATTGTVYRITCEEKGEHIGI